MGEVTMEVPAAHVETLRNAVVAEVGLWNSALSDDLEAIREARNGPPTTRDDEDLRNHQRALAEAGALANQLPANGGAAKLQGGNEALASLTDEGARACIRDLSFEAEYAPLDVADIRKRIEALDWWLSQHESHEAARLAEVEASRGGAG